MLGGVGGMPARERAGPSELSLVVPTGYWSSAVPPLACPPCPADELGGREGGNMDRIASKSDDSERVTRERMRAMIYPSNAGVYNSEIFAARLNDGRTGPTVTP